MLNEALTELKKTCDGYYINPFSNHLLYEANNALVEINHEKRPAKLFKLYRKVSFLLNFFLYDYSDNWIIPTCTVIRDAISKFAQFSQNEGWLFIAASTQTQTGNTQLGSIDDTKFNPLPTVSNRHIHTANNLLRAISKEQSSDVLLIMVRKLYLNLHLIEQDLSKIKDIIKEVNCLLRRIDLQKNAFEELLRNKPKPANKKETTISSKEIEDQVFLEMRSLGLKQLLRSYPRIKTPKPLERIVSATPENFVEDDHLYLDRLFTSVPEKKEIQITPVPGKKAMPSSRVESFETVCTDEEEPGFSKSHQSFFYRKKANKSKDHKIPAKLCSPTGI
ncbi:hypothetical protein [Legionella quinlivanii]|uniref:hypothetical protein n=1 Tax=Legionella quinlivanii TaxID=45073 RepID=UPI0022445EE7|nr:hypothetical protein [Legionella quinlivanii]MCW8450789.1 hypothetical protein [Legionella quinlivanii]